MNLFGILSASQWKELVKFFRVQEAKLDWLLLRKTRFEYSVGPVTYKSKLIGGSKMLEVNITNEQEVVVTLNPKTATGKPAKVQDGSVTWTVQSGDATLTPADDGLSCKITSADLPGDTSIVVDADADLGEGVTDVNDIVLVHVAGAQASNLGLSAGEPTPKA